MERGSTPGARGRRRILSAALGLGLVTGLAWVAPTPATAADTGNRAPFVLADPFYSGSTVTRYCLKLAYDPATISYKAVGAACSPDGVGTASQWYLTPLAAYPGYVQLESALLVGYCVEDLSTSTTPWLRRCAAGTAGQRWSIAPAGDEVSLQSARSGRYLDVNGLSVSIVTSHQTQLLVPSGTANIQFRSVYSGKCMDVDNNPGGTRVQQWTCLGAAQANQLFHVIPSGWSDSTSYPVYLAPRHTSGWGIQPDCTAKTSCPENRTPLVIDSLTGSLIAPWHIRLAAWNADGLRFQLVNYLYDTCADLRAEGAGRDDGTVIQEWECLGTNKLNQLWRITVP
ncbi:MAG: RICIN domain-containing protein [Actinomycetales bacterium]|nr:RICIN domain-containing protein [Actinomycetales bacterium]